MSFVVLVGSRARGDWNDRSDVDIVKIGSVDAGKLEEVLPVLDGPVNVIEYSGSDFERIYAAGSLFLQHCFSEGRLLSGDIAAWNRLMRGFCVQETFRSEIRKCAEVCALLAHVGMFGGYFRTPCVAAYTQAKNAAIFFLAENGIYCFNKDAAIRRAATLANAPVADLICSLRALYDYAERGLDVPLPFQIDDVNRCEEAVRVATGFVRRISDACERSGI